ncbi:hypothetical protein SDC9_89830 [bioreactor metagenome]|uniref:GGDEF domain-containing protein n=1 Tax=bioreactor metagenome TaxID=1076179 RepID=A0A644ZQX2_9ZZZZ
MAIVYLELNLFAVTVLMLIFFSKRHSRSFYRDQNLFDALIFSNIFMLFTDTAMWLLDGKQFEGALFWNTAVTFLYFLGTPFVCFFWLLYCDNAIYVRSRKRLMKIMPLYSIPLFVNSVFTIASLKYNFLFYIDANNIYHRGACFYIYMAAALIYPLYAAFISVKKAVSVVTSKRREYFFLSLFMLPPVIGAIIQSMYYGLALLWSCTAISILMIFINVQNDRISTDELTGINNRRQMNRYLEQLSKYHDHDKYVTAMMIDIDRFKFINDTYGHCAGDAALVTIASLLKQACNEKKAFLARVGGDEFVIIYIHAGKDEPAEFIEQINYKIDDVNIRSNNGYKLSLSIGYAYGECGKPSVDDLILEADKKMYEVKKHYAIKSEA